ncbi:MAG: LEPR-XLL domain-containing protein, partial [Candidatus Omnitrophica bacterium]|nr:LEPR-XLL domain-containing protein [Candidatus Omnitrophota bacterium]
MAYPFMPFQRKTSECNWWDKVKTVGSDLLQKREAPPVFDRSFIARYLPRRSRKRYAAPRKKKMLLEALEPRILLSGETLDYTADPNTAADLNLQVSGSEIQVVDNNTSTVVAHKELSETSVVNITGSLLGDSVTIDSINASAPLTINIQGSAGDDSVTIEGILSLGGGDVSVQAETILLDDGGAIGNVDDVYLTAIAEDYNTVTDAGALEAKSASISIEGDIQSTGDISLTSHVTRKIDVNETSILSSASLDSSSTASVEVGGGASIFGSSLTMHALTEGFVDSESVNAATNTFTESAIASISNAVINVGHLDLRAETGTDYSAKGRNAFNNVSGETKAFIENSMVTTADIAGVQIAARDFSTLMAESPELSIDLDLLAVGASVDVNLARNALERDTEAFIQNSTVTAANGDIGISAEREMKVGATVSAASLTGTSIIDGSLKVDASFGGSYAANQILGDVRAYIAGGSVETVGAGDVTLYAADLSAIDAKSEISIYSKTNPLSTDSLSGAFGASIAFNAIGWEIDNFFTRTIDTLLGTDVNDAENPADVTAFIQDSTVSAAGDLALTALSKTKINATVSNAAVSTASSLYGAQGMAASGVLASNWMSSTAKAYIDYTGAAGKVNAKGSITVAAQDQSEIHSNSKIVSSSITTSDGGANVFNDVIGLILTTKYSTEDGVKTVDFGDRIWIANDYDEELGNPGSVYQYMGEDGSVIDLGSEDYTNLDFWKEATETQLIPEGNNFTPSDSITIGGLVVRNDVRSEVESYINNAEVDADTGNITLNTFETAIIEAIVDSAFESSGGSSFGDKGESIAVNGVIATNLVLSKSNAYIEDSAVTASIGYVKLDAKNDSRIDAKNLNATVSEGDTVGVILAFNTIGYQAQNILFNTLDALLGLDIGNQQPAGVQAYILDSSVTAGDNISLSAVSSASLNAELSTEATSAAAAFYGSGTMAASGVLASNMVSSLAKAYIENTDSVKSVDAGRNISIYARDAAAIDSSTSLVTSSKATNDIGVGILNDFIDTLLYDYQYTSNSGLQTLQFGDKVRVAGDYDDSKGKPEKIYKYMGTGGQYDLGSQDYIGDYGLWQELDASNIIPTGIAKAAMKIFDLKGGDMKGYYAMVVRNDVKSDVEAYIDNALVTAQGNILLTAQESAHITAADNSVVAAGTESKGGVIAANQVLSRANAYITDSQVVTDPGSSGNIVLSGFNDSLIDAALYTEANAKETIGIVVAFNAIGWDSSNILFEAIDALLGTDWLTSEQPAEVQTYISNSAVSADGDLLLTAETESQVNATVGNEVSSTPKNDRVLIDAAVELGKDENKDKEFKNLKYGVNGMSAGAVLASNRVSSMAKAYIDHNEYDYTTSDGWQYLLPGARVKLDANTGGGSAGEVYEYVGQDLLEQLEQIDPLGFMDLADLLELDALAEFLLEVNLAGENFSDASHWVLVSYPAQAGEVDADNISIAAHDAAGIHSSSELAASTVVVNNMDAFTQLAENLNKNEYQYTTESGERTLIHGDRVRLGTNWSDNTYGAYAGDVYEYQGVLLPDVDLGALTADDLNSGLWVRITGAPELSDLFPNFGNLADSNAKAYGGMVVLNDVRGEAESHIYNSDIDALSNITVQAVEDASIQADAKSRVDASGGSAWGSGTVIALQGTVATNLVHSHAKSFILDSDITTTDPGHIGVTAKNTSKIDSTVHAANTSGDEAKNLLLALNTLGYSSQNALLDAVEALLSRVLGV